MSPVSAPLPDAYGPIVPFYDSGYAKLAAERMDVPFYLDLARRGAGPVLELGCGTGRVLLPIADAGFPCTGLDASASMLKALRTKPYPASLRLVHGPMQRFDFGEDRFGLIFAAFRGFQHLLDVRDQLECLARVRGHLAPGGTFAFDVFRPLLDRLPMGPQPPREDLRFSHQGREVVRTAQVQHDPIGQRIRVELCYTHANADDAPPLATSAMTLRYFFRFELEHLLARAGFRDVRIHGTFQGGPIEAGTDLIVIARA